MSSYLEYLHTLIEEAATRQVDLEDQLMIPSEADEHDALYQELRRVKATIAVYSQMYADEEFSVKRQHLRRHLKTKKYFLTLTLKEGSNSDHTQILTLLNKLRSCKAVLTFEGAWELTDKGTLHAHILIIAKIPIKHTQIKQFANTSKYKYFFDFKTVKTDNGIRNYMQKQQQDTELISTLASYNIQTPVIQY